ncbi:GGDEF domain-containing protein [Ilumatobacter coccineus]|uniref:GGDEF domain-containing protein n=1 Tax=Ilumatobacter coccineus (strain NBRC 103263 / KCTC 29153 / YM16-304) TaxID=1313172 RepID=A0A6C7E8Z8_ILUCY|nr:GGDEF domain-containing protein [Ilumatobacter coccineus]BAN02492.1 hypothetical protein YM304_21780 [Ilumatobacter coccineus YM16-304]
MSASPNMPTGRLNRTALTWVIVSVLVVTPLETVALDTRVALLTLPFRAGALLVNLYLLRTGRIGPIGCGRAFLAQGLLTMVGWSLVLAPDPDRVALEAVAYGTILSIFALMIAPRSQRRWWAAGVVAIALLPAAIHLIPDDTILFFQACAVLIVHGAAIAVLDVHTHKAEEAGAMASIDPLTGLLNRRSMVKRLDQRIALAGPEGEASSVLLIDLDHFKSINDSRGHLAGDAALVDVADAMTSTVRPTDQVCRWGGEEFLVLLPASGLAAATHTAERLRTVIAGTGVTASIGVADVRRGDTVSEWVRRADLALYAAKRDGRNRVSTDVVQVTRRHARSVADLDGERTAAGTTSA